MQDRSPAGAGTAPSEHQPDPGRPPFASGHGARGPDDGERHEGPVRAEIVALAVVAIAVGIALRFVTRSALWLDEALTVNIASLPLGELEQALRHDGHPPLYYVLLHGWMELFGQGDGAVRALSGAFGVVSLGLAWLYGRRRGGATLAWCYTAVLAMAPFALRYGSENRMYSLIIVLVLAAALLVDDIVGRGRDGWGRVAGAAVLTALLLYTHYWSIWLLAAGVVWLAWTWWRHRDVPTRRACARLMGAMVVGGILFLPWVPTMLYQSAHTGTPWAAPLRPTTVLSLTLADISAGPFPDAGLVAAVTVVLALLALFGRATSGRFVTLDLRTERRYRPEAAIAVLALALGTAFTYATWSAYATRYAAVVVPLFLLLVAAGLTVLVARWVRFGALVALLALFSIGAAWNVRDWRTQARQFADGIEAVAQPGDLVVYCPDQLGPATSRALGAADDDLDLRLDQVVYPTFAPPELVDWVDYADRNAAADPEAFATEALARAEGRAIFLVWNTSYRTFEGQCERLVATLGAARPAQEIVSNPGGRFFENGAVTWLPAP
jgi:mannosyltransferase